MVPKASIWMIRTSLLYLLTGMLIGGGMLATKADPSYAYFYAYLNLHVELMLFGWILQLFMGTAYWILPRHPARLARGPEWMIWGVFLFLNLGMFSAIISALMYNSTLLFTSRLLELAAFILFVLLMWPRVRPFVNQPQL